MEMAKSLKGNSTLTELYLQSNRIGDAGAKAFSDCICENSVLIDLHLGINSITDEGAKSLIDSLNHNQTLIHLYLSGNNISHDIKDRLGNILSWNALGALEEHTIIDFPETC